MLKFFRKIRQNLIAKRDIKRYVLYAVGEIFLVVIGILIALQINTWNENRKTDIVRQQLYQGLEEEFQLVKKLHLDKRAAYDAVQNAGLTILKNTGKGKTEMSIATFDSLLAANLQLLVFNPSFVVFREIMETEKIGLIDNTNIKSLLYQYQAIHSDYRAMEEVSLTDITEHLVPYLNKRVAFKNIDFRALNLPSPSSIQTDNRHILMDLEFENLMDTRYFVLKHQLEFLEQLGETIDSLLVELKRAIVDSKGEQEVNPLN